MTKQHAKKIAKSWASAIIWNAAANDQFSQLNLSIKDETKIMEEMKKISARLGRYLPIRTSLPEIVKSILQNEK